MRFNSIGQKKRNSTLKGTKRNEVIKMRPEINRVRKTGQFLKTMVFEKPIKADKLVAKQIKMKRRNIINIFKEKCENL